MEVVSYRNKKLGTEYTIEYVPSGCVEEDYQKLEKHIPISIRDMYLQDMVESSINRLAYAVKKNGAKLGSIHLKKLNDGKYFAVSLLIESDEPEVKFILLSYVLDKYNIVTYKPINDNHLEMKSVITTRSLRRYNQGITDTVYLTSNGRSTSKMLKYFGLE